MDYDKNICPVVDVEGVIENGKQFDLEIKLPDVNQEKCKFGIYFMNWLFFIKYNFE